MYVKFPLACHNILSLFDWLISKNTENVPKTQMVKHHVANIAEASFQNKGVELIKSATISGKTLLGANMNSLTGILYQLNSLASVANELFQSVLDSSKETYTRLNNISSRIGTVNEKLSSIEEYIEQNSTQFYANGSYKLSENNVKVFRQKTEHCVDSNNFPPALRWQYDTNTENLPNFDILNEYHEKKDCLKDFSDPGFFFESWASFELAKIEKKNRDKVKKPKKDRVVEIAKSVSKVDKYGFTKEDGKHQQGTRHEIGEDDLPPPPPEEDMEIPGPPPDDDDGENYQPPPPEDDDNPPPPPMENPEDEIYQHVQPKVTKTVAPPTPKQQTISAPKAPTNAPPPPMAPGLPPPPPDGSGITFSKKNNVEKKAVPQTGGRNNLLDAIKNQDNKLLLKKVTIEDKPKVEAKAPQNSIASILENKFAKTIDSDDDSDKDDDW